MTPNGDGAATAADQSVESHLNDGETVTATLETAGGRLYATSQRVLVVPDGDRPVRSYPRSDAADIRVDTVTRGATRLPFVILRGLAGKLTAVRGLAPSSWTNPVGPADAGDSETRPWHQSGLLAMAAFTFVAGLHMLTSVPRLAIAGLAGLWGLSRQPAVRINILEGDDLVLPGEVTDRRELYAFRDAVFTE
jgi:hypothetical protein